MIAVLARFGRRRDRTQTAVRADPIRSSGGDERVQKAVAAQQLLDTKHSWILAYAIVIVSLLGTAAIQMDAYLNHDVAWFAWGANRILHGAVLGRDILEPNFPLAYLVYLPAALISPATGLSAAVKIWILALMGISAAVALHRLEDDARLPFAVGFGLFCALGLPREFGQREQIAFLLVIPYCVQSREHERYPILSGVMAGIGFAIKPHFLLAWLAVEWGRPLFRREQLALVITGATYVVIIAAFFQSFVWDMLPLTRHVYWAFDRPGDATDTVVAITVCGFLLAAADIAQDRPSKSFAQAGIGFCFAALLQQRFYPYQLLPAWGFMALATAQLLRHLRLGTAVTSLVSLTTLLTLVAPASLAWLRHPDHRSITPRFTALLDEHRSFAVLSVYPYPAFPTAIYTRAKYVGLSNSEWFLPAVAQSEERNAYAKRAAIYQASMELSRNPEIVLVDTDWRRHTRTDRRWNGLQFLLGDPDFRASWSRYHRVGRIGSYDVFGLSAGGDLSGLRHSGPIPIGEIVRQPK